MRRLSRVSRSADLWTEANLSIPISPYLCAACRARHSPRATAIAPRSNFSTSTARPAELPFTERLRRKIWGTDTPPGSRDPYTESQLLPREGEQAPVQEKPGRSVRSIPNDPTYVPATNWEGLEQVGGQGGWWKENWDPEHRFESYMPSNRLTTPEELTAALRRAVIEVYIFSQAGKPLSDLSSSWDSVDYTSSVQIALSPDQRSVDISIPGDEAAAQDLRTQILESNVVSQPATIQEETEEVIDTAAEEIIPQEDRQAQDQAAAEEASAEDVAVEAEEEIVELDEAELQEARETRLNDIRQQIASWDVAWLQVPFANPEIKFSVIKRISRLTGQQIPDPVIANLTSVGSLLAQLVKPPRAKKLAERLMADDLLRSLPNVTLHDRRVTPIDKEKAVGRWKVIERELLQRDLPITGHR